MTTTESQAPPDEERADTTKTKPKPAQDRTRSRTRPASMSRTHVPAAPVAFGGGGLTVAAGAAQWISVAGGTPTQALLAAGGSVVAGGLGYVVYRRTKRAQANRTGQKNQRRERERNPFPWSRNHRTTGSRTGSRNGSGNRGHRGGASSLLPKHGPHRSGGGSRSGSGGRGTGRGRVLSALGGGKRRAAGHRSEAGRGSRSLLGRVAGRKGKNTPRAAAGGSSSTAPGRKPAGRTAGHGRSKAGLVSGLVSPLRRRNNGNGRGSNKSGPGRGRHSGSSGPGRNSRGRNSNSTSGSKAGWRRLVPGKSNPKSNGGDGSQNNNRKRPGRNTHSTTRGELLGGRGANSRRRRNRNNNPENQQINGGNPNNQNGGNGRRRGSRGGRNRNRGNRQHQNAPATGNTMVGRFGSFAHKVGDNVRGQGGYAQALKEPVKGMSRKDIKRAAKGWGATMTDRWEKRTGQNPLQPAAADPTGSWLPQPKRRKPKGGKPRNMSGSVPQAWATNPRVPWSHLKDRPQDSKKQGHTVAASDGGKKMGVFENFSFEDATPDEVKSRLGQLPDDLSGEARKYATVAQNLDGTAFEDGARDIMQDLAQIMLSASQQAEEAPAQFTQANQVGLEFQEQYGGKPGAGGWAQR